MDTAEVPRAALHPLIGESGARLPQSKTSPESHSQECFSGLFRCERFYGRTAIQQSAFSSFWICRLYQGLDTERSTRACAYTIHCNHIFCCHLSSPSPPAHYRLAFSHHRRHFENSPGLFQKVWICKANVANPAFRIGNLQYRGGVITVPR